jgi:type II secretory pathway component PulF
MPLTTSAAQRFVLFQSLYDVSQSPDNDWGQLIALFSKGRQAAQRAQLAHLEERFANGQQLMLEELRDGGLFLEWELQFMQLGLAAGNLGRVYLRLAEHYRLLCEFYRRLRTHAWLPLGLLLIAALAIPVLVGRYSGQGLGDILRFQLLGLAPLFGLGVVWGALYFSPFLRRRGLGVLYRLPGLGSALTQYQSYHFINHLGECLSAGIPMNQALRQSARRMPESPVRRRYMRLASEVERGDRFSAALLKSGILNGVELPSMAADASAREVPARLSLAIHQACERQLRFWSASLPYLLLGLLPYILLLNGVFLRS